MTVTDLNYSIAKFVPTITKITTDKEIFYALRENFTSYFSLNKIKEMDLEDFALGLPKKNTFNFCHTLESSLERLGNIHGGTAIKFGFYFGITKKDQTKKWHIKKSYGTDPETALSTAKNNIVALIDAGKTNDLETIDKIDISPMFKGKILNIYYPNKYLNIYSFDHLDNYLLHLNLPEYRGNKISLTKKREALLSIKDSNSEMKNWSIDIFSEFLYLTIGEPKKKKEDKLKDPLNKFRDPIFPTSQKIELLDLSISDEPLKSSTKKKKNVSGEPPDYEGKSRKQKILGTHGETLVLAWEKKRLSKAGQKGLAVNVAKKKLDSDGFDIVSYDIDGKERQIEVKATSNKHGQANFFLSRNEFEKALQLPNYYIYMLYDILSKHPKLWIIKNPFNPEKSSVHMTPISYRVQINYR